jgi:uncharacterized glyoxalase superfamily protein PhnB
MTQKPRHVLPMRLVVEASDYDEAVAFYRDVLGAAEELQVHGEDGEKVTILDAQAATGELVGAGASLVAPPTRTPWDSLNARLEGPAGLQLTLFEELAPTEPSGD